LRRLAVLVDVDPLGQPLVDACDVPRVGQERVQAGEGRAHHPAVVRRVDPADHQGLARGAGEALQVGDHPGGERRGELPDHGERGAHRIEREGGVGRGVEVRRVQVDRAVRVLEGEEPARGEGEP
jgi:hypothetical protein